MKVAYLSTFHPFRGGIAQFNARLLRELQRQQHQVEPFTFSRQYPDLLFPGKTQLVAPGDPSEPVNAPRVLDSIWPPSWYSTARRIARTQPDLLLMKYWMTFFGPSLGTVAGHLKARGTKVVTILDNVVPHEGRFFDKPFTRYFLKHNHGFVAMSASVQRDLLTLRPDAPVKLLPHPLYDHFGAPLPQADARRQLGLPPDARVLLFFGLIRDYKGLDLLIDAFGALDARYHLVIAGEPYGDFTPYQRAIDASPLRANIHAHARYIGDGEVPQFFSAADVVVLPYKSATQSGITAIAYHFGVPLVATDTGGLKEAVHHGRTGLVVREVSAAAIAAGVRDLFEHQDLNAFRSHITALQRELSWDHFCTELMTFARGL